MARAPGWWLTFARGIVALCLGGALIVAGAGQSRLATFIGIYWLLGSVLTIRWVLPKPGSSRQALGGDCSRDRSAHRIGAPGPKSVG